MFLMHKDKIDEWLNDYEAFNHDFRSFCGMHFRVHEIHSEFIPEVLKQIHAQWKKDHDSWLEDEMGDGTIALSQTKICALLLYNLVSEAFLGNVFPHEYQEENKYTFRGTDEQKEQAKADLLDAREASLALDFIILTINWIEQNRIDRATEFRQPLTPGMRHDLLSFLLHGRRDRKAIYLILEALYLRPKKSD